MNSKSVTTIAGETTPAKPATIGTPPVISPLRQRMIDDMIARNLGPHSQRSHIEIAAFLQRSPDPATADDVCACQKHRTSSSGGS